MDLLTFFACIIYMSNKVCKKKSELCVIILNKGSFNVLKLHSTNFFCRISSNTWKFNNRGNREN